MRALMVMSSTFDPPDSVAARIAQLKAFAAPYYLFADAGLEVTLASPEGGGPPIAWSPPMDANPIVERYRRDRYTRDLLNDTLPLSEVYPGDFSLVLYPGDCPGNVMAMRELAENPASARLISALWATAPLGFVGSATAALLNLKDGAGLGLLDGRRITGATPGEQRTLSAFPHDARMLEDELREQNAIFTRGDDWSPRVVIDGLLVTGQNANAAERVAQAVLDMALA